MAKVSVYNSDGQVVTEKSIPAAIFGVSEKSSVISQAVIKELANRRHVIANTKTRGEVSGGGRKPFKQKGTGNARAGSTRSPLWIGGGITFGPRKNRNFKKRLPKKMTRLALRMALSQKFQNKKLLILQNFSMTKISTKLAEEIIVKLPIKEGKILIVLPKIDANIELSFANIPYVKIIKSNNLNVFDILNADYLLLTDNVLDQMSKTATPKTQEKAAK